MGMTKPTNAVMAFEVAGRPVRRNLPTPAQVKPTEDDGPERAMRDYYQSIASVPRA